MFPLSTVLFPHAVLSLHVFEPRYRTMTADCLRGDRAFGVVLIERGSEVGGGDVRVTTGTMATIEEASPLPDGRWLLVARGTRRIHVARWLPDAPYPVAEVEMLPGGAVGGDPGAEPGAAPPEAPPETERASGAVRRARALLSELGSAPMMATDAIVGADLAEREWSLCAGAPLGTMDRQRLLEIDDRRQRMTLLADLADACSDDLSRLLAEGSGSEN